MEDLQGSVHQIFGSLTNLLRLLKEDLYASRNIILQRKFRTKSGGDSNLKVGYTSLEKLTNFALGNFVAHRVMNGEDRTSDIAIRADGAGRVGKGGGTLWTEGVATAGKNQRMKVTSQVSL